MPQQFFYIVSKSGALGLGQFPYHTWHKQEKENILKEVGLKVEYGAELFKGEDKGTFRTVGDKEHLEIIRLHVEEDRGTNDIATVMKRSSKTIVDHIYFHNAGVEKATFCSRCKRANGVYAQMKATRQLLAKQEN